MASFLHARRAARRRATEVRTSFPVHYAGRREERPGRSPSQRSEIAAARGGNTGEHLGHWKYSKSSLQRCFDYALGTACMGPMKAKNTVKPESRQWPLERRGRPL